MFLYYMMILCIISHVWNIYPLLRTQNWFIYILHIQCEYRREREMHVKHILFPVCSTEKYIINSGMNLIVSYCIKFMTGIILLLSLSFYFRFSFSLFYLWSVGAFLKTDSDILQVIFFIHFPRYYVIEECEIYATIYSHTDTSLNFNHD